MKLCDLVHKPLLTLHLCCWIVLFHRKLWVRDFFLTVTTLLMYIRFFMVRCDCDCVFFAFSRIFLDFRWLHFIIYMFEAKRDIRGFQLLCDVKIITLTAVCYYRPEWSCGQGYVFTRVCDSVHSGGVCLSACWDTAPWEQALSREQAPPQEQAPPWHTVNEWPVCILLECILVTSTRYCHTCGQEICN